MPRLAAAAREQRRQALVDAASRCVARTSYRNVTVDDVCAEAGLSKGAFYTYFEHKQDLLLALLEDDAARTEELVAAAASEGSSGPERIGRIVGALLERGADAAAVQLRADLWAEVQSDDSVRAKLLETVQGRRRALGELIEEAASAGTLVDVPPNALAAVLLALGDGLMLHRVLDPSGFRWPNVRRAVDAIVGGLRPPSP